MSENTYTAQDIRKAAESVGFAPAMSEAQKRREHKNLDERLFAGTFPQAVEALAKSEPAPARTRKTGKFVAAVATGAALLAPEAVNAAGSAVADTAVETVVQAKDRVEDRLFGPDETVVHIDPSEEQVNISAAPRPSGQ